MFKGNFKNIPAKPYVKYRVVDKNATRSHWKTNLQDKVEMHRFEISTVRKRKTKKTSQTMGEVYLEETESGDIFWKQIRAEAQNTTEWRQMVEQRALSK